MGVHHSKNKKTKGKVEKEEKSVKRNSGSGYHVKNTVTGHYSNLRAEYDIQSKEIGHGHFGSVFVGVHKETGRRDAIKVIPKRHVRNLSTLRNEIDIMKEVNGHPNTPDLYAVFEDHRNLYLAMTLCEGGGAL